MAIFNYPHHIDKDTPATAVEVQSNFDALLNWVMDNVMLKDGSLPATGPIVLPPGPPVAPDHAANKAYVDAVVPVGTIWEYGGTQLPEGWLWCDAEVYTTGQHQELYNKIQRAFTGAAIPQGSFQVPDKRGKFSMGAGPSDALGKGSATAVGQRDSELLYHTHVVPEHGHTLTIATNSTDHQHWFSGLTAAGEGGHIHTGTGFNQQTGVGFRGPQWNAGGWGAGADPGAQGGWYTTPPVASDGSAHQHNVSNLTNYQFNGTNASHSHPGSGVANQVAFGTEPNGAGGTLIDKNLPPYVVVNYIIYRGKL